MNMLDPVVTKIGTRYSASFQCECGGTVEVNGGTDRILTTVTIGGVPCLECERTYTVEVSKQVEGLTEVKER